MSRADKSDVHLMGIVPSSRLHAIDNPTRKLKAAKFSPTHIG